MRNIISVVIIIAIVVGFTSFSSASDESVIEDKMIQIAIFSASESSINDIDKRRSVVEITAHTKDGKRQWASAIITIHSKKWGEYKVSGYLALFKKGFSLKHYEAKGVLASVEYNENVDNYNHHRAHSKALVEHHGDETAFAIVSIK